MILRRLKSHMTLWVAFVPVFWLLLLCGCNQKELLYPCEDSCRLEVRFLWNRAEGADPEGMTLLFYPLEEGGEFWRFEVAGRDGGEVELPRGRYTMLAVNNDLGGIRLRDWPYAQAAALTRGMSHSEMYTLPTGMVFRGETRDITVRPGKVSYSGDDGVAVTEPGSVVYCHPDSLSTIYNVVLMEVDGLERVRSVRGVLKGCMSGMLLGTSVAVSPDVAVQFAMTSDAEKGILRGITSGFRPTGPNERYELTVQVTLLDGAAYEKTFTIDSVLPNTSATHDVYIIVKGLTLPDIPVAPVDPDEVGLKVDVDGWTEIEIDINTEKNKSRNE